VPCDRIAPYCRLESIIVTLRDDDPWMKYVAARTTLERSSAREIPAIHFLVSWEDNPTLFSNKSQLDRIDHMSYIICNIPPHGQHLSPDLDFSRCRKLVVLQLYSDDEVSLFRLPNHTGTMEVLALGLSYFTGYEISFKFLSFERLQELELPSRCSPTPMDMKIFPVLRRFMPTECPRGTKFKSLTAHQSGMALVLEHFHGEFVQLECPVRSLELNWVSLENSHLWPILPKVTELKVGCRNATDLMSLSQMLCGGHSSKEPHFALKRMQRLELKTSSMNASSPVSFGKCPSLLHLTLEEGVVTVLRGENFPLLESINIDHGHVKLVGYFAALRSVRLFVAFVDTDFEFSAPLLRSVSILDTRNANRIILGRRKFPSLQTVFLRNNAGWSEDVFPQLLPDEALDRPLIRLQLAFDTPDRIVRRMAKRVPKWWTELAPRPAF